MVNGWRAAFYSGFKWKEPRVTSSIVKSQMRECVAESLIWMIGTNRGQKSLLKSIADSSKFLDRLERNKTLAPVAVWSRLEAIKYILFFIHFSKAHRKTTRTHLHLFQSMDKHPEILELKRAHRYAMCWVSKIGQLCEWCEHTQNFWIFAP